MENKKIVAKEIKAMNGVVALLLLILGMAVACVMGVVGGMITESDALPAALGGYAGGRSGPYSSIFYNVCGT